MMFYLCTRKTCFTSVQTAGLQVSPPNFLLVWRYFFVFLRFTVIITLVLRSILGTNACHLLYRMLLPAYEDSHNHRMTLSCRQDTVLRNTGRFQHQVRLKQSHLKKESRM